MRDEKTYKIIGCAMEVHKELGCGFLEAVYQEALERELLIQGVPFKSQHVVEIAYKGGTGWGQINQNETFQIDTILHSMLGVGSWTLDVRLFN